MFQGTYDRARIHKDYPQSGYRYDETGAGEGRVLLYNHFRIAYRVKSGDEVDILGVFLEAFHQRTPKRVAGVQKPPGLLSFGVSSQAARAFADHPGS